MSITAPEQWQDNRRCDGVTVESGVDGWMIIPASGLPWTACPCCGWPFKSARLARVCADALYPVARD